MINSENEKRSTLQSAPLSPTTEGEESESPLDDRRRKLLLSRQMMAKTLTSSFGPEKDQKLEEK